VWRRVHNEWDVILRTRGVSGQGRPGALRIPGESGSSIRTSSGPSTKVELAARVVTVGVLFMDSGGGGGEGEVAPRKK
jgi:hypothetical protein